MRTDIEKRKRQDLIREIIRSKPIGTQEELVAEVKNHNMDVTQTTVSRDLEDLEVGKWNGKYHIAFAPGENIAWFGTFRQHVMNIRKAGEHLLILKTKEGSASMIENMLNDLFQPEIAGVVSSGRTVMIAFERQDQQSKTLDVLTQATDLNVD